MSARNLLEQSAMAPQMPNRIAVFGLDRLLDAVNNPSTPEANEELLRAIANAATDVGGVAIAGMYNRQLDQAERYPLGLTWDAAQISMGFVPPTTERPVATVSNMYCQKRWVRPPGSWPGRFTVTEDIEVTNVGRVNVVRTFHPVNGMRSLVYAKKPASASEVAAALQVVTNVQGENSGVLPLFVEIGFGMDPSIIRGFRKAENKIHLAVDPARGNYVSGHGVYSDAVQTRSMQLARSVGNERPGEHIYFALSEGHHLPVANNRASEVFMANILNAPDIDEATKRGILAEAYRILGPSTRLVVQVNWHQDAWPAEAMSQFLRQSGFDVRKIVQAAEHPGYRLLESEYGVQQEVKAPQGYYLIAEPSTHVL